MTYTENIFMDSGAWSLFRLHVLKQGQRAQRIGKHGRLLEEPVVRGGQGDFSYYDLKPGSPFRRYCDSYAAFVKRFGDRVELFANLDAIGSPERTWETQMFFENEHGLKLVPVVHHGASLDWVDRYLERGHKVIGLGGFARKVDPQSLKKWTDQVFCHLCPKSNEYKPIVRIHGFALTAWDYIVRWPWSSVDSTSWVKYSAYGWICLPRYIRGKFRYDRPPLVVNMSWRSPFKADRHKHMNNVIGDVQEAVRRWLDHVNVPIGRVDSTGKEIHYGVVSSHVARSKANCHYYMELADSLPDWPWSLPGRLRQAREQQGGFGLV